MCINHIFRPHRYLLAFDPKGNLMPMASRRPRKKAAGRLFILQNCWLFLFLFLCSTTTRGEWQQPTWSASWVSGSRMNFYWLQIHSYIIIIITLHSCSCAVSMQMLDIFSFATAFTFCLSPFDVWDESHYRGSFVPILIISWYHRMIVYEISS